MSARTPVRVSSLQNASAHKGWAQQVISLLDPDIKPARIPTPDMLGVMPEQHFTLFFDDVEERTSPSGCISPVFTDWEKIFAFADHTQNILVHCHGGISRSSATAIGLMIGRGFNPEDAVEMVLSQNIVGNEGQFMDPNILLLEFIDEFFGLQNKLVPLVRQSLKTQQLSEQELETLLAKCGPVRIRAVPSRIIPVEILEAAPIAPMMLRCPAHNVPFDTGSGCIQCQPSRGQSMSSTFATHVPVILQCSRHELHFDTRWGCPRCR